MAVALSTVPTGSFFTTNAASVTAPQQNYLLSGATGSSGTMLVAYNITQSAIQELVNTTMVDVLTLGVVDVPRFSLT